MFLGRTLAEVIVYPHTHTFTHKMSRVHENTTTKPIVKHNSYILIKKTNKKIEPTWAT